VTAACAAGADVTGARVIPVPGRHDSAPDVTLLDALAAGLDDAGLRAWARAHTAACGRPHVVRSYRYPYALLACHSEPVGVDIERIEPCDPAFAELIRTPAERASPAPVADPGSLADRAPHAVADPGSLADPAPHAVADTAPLAVTDPTPLADPDAHLASLWCSKEALSKALGDALRYDPARLDSPMRWPELRCGPWRAAALATVPGHTAWLCWRAAGGADPTGVRRGREP